jgi:hypothetical protein
VLYSKGKETSRDYREKERSKEKVKKEVTREGIQKKNKTRDFSLPESPDRLLTHPASG